jgi:hypothetical protein
MLQTWAFSAMRFLAPRSFMSDVDSEFYDSSACIPNSTPKAMYVPGAGPVCWDNHMTEVMYAYGGKHSI